MHKYTGSQKENLEVLQHLIFQVDWKYTENWKYLPL